MISMNVGWDDQCFLFFVGKLVENPSCCLADECFSKWFSRSASALFRGLKQVRMCLCSKKHIDCIQNKGVRL